MGEHKSELIMNRAKEKCLARMHYACSITASRSEIEDMYVLINMACLDVRLLHCSEWDSFEPPSISDDNSPSHA